MAVEILRKITTAWVGCTNVIDDRQTDDTFTFAKNSVLTQQRLTADRNFVNPHISARALVTN